MIDRNAAWLAACVAAVTLSGPVLARAQPAPAPAQAAKAWRARPGGKPSAAAPSAGRRGRERRSADPYDYPLGALPRGFTIHRPQRPEIRREVQVRSAAEFNRFAAQPGTRLRVRLGIATPVRIGASDVEVVAGPSVRIAALMIAKGTRRVRVSGGEYGHIAMQLPNGGAMGKPFSGEDYAHDVMIDGVTVRNDDPGKIGIELYGRRVAIVDARVHTATYAIYGRGIEPGPTAAALPIEDLIVAGCVLESRGRSPRGDGSIEGAKNEATVRLRHMQRSAIVDSYLVNSVDGFVPVPEGSATKANYRIHGKSDQNLFARNVLVNSGTQFAFSDDDLGAFYFYGNTFYHSAPDLFNPKAGKVRYVEARHNVVYTRSRWRCLGCSAKRPHWKIEHNVFKPFVKPPRPPDRPRRLRARPVQDGPRDARIRPSRARDRRGAGPDTAAIPPARPGKPPRP